jgi:hypothetical protein
MPSLKLLVNKHPQRAGELVEQSLVFPELQEEVLTDLAKEPLETCAVVVVCSAPQKYGEDGTSRLARVNADLLPALPCLPLLLLPLSWLVVTELKPLLKSLWLSLMPTSMPFPRPRKLLPSLRPSVPPPSWSVLLPLEESEVVREKPETDAMCNEEALSLSTTRNEETKLSPVPSEMSRELIYVTYTDLTFSNLLLEVTLEGL